MTIHFTRRKAALLLGLAPFGLAARPAAAGALPAPSGKVVLTITGHIATQNGNGAARFDLAMLEAMGMQRIVTTTPWYSGAVTFEGVPLNRLMKAVEATGDHITAFALNDYSTDIPMEDFAHYNVILALKRNGEYMPVRDKGPLFIVYPYDSVPELKHQKFYSRSAWQLSRIVVK